MRLNFMMQQTRHGKSNLDLIRETLFPTAHRFYLTEFVDVKLNQNNGKKDELVITDTNGYITTHIEIPRLSNGKVKEFRYVLTDEVLELYDRAYPLGTIYFLEKPLLDLDSYLAIKLRSMDVQMGTFSCISENGKYLIKVFEEDEGFKRLCKPTTEMDYTDHWPETLITDLRTYHHVQFLFPTDGTDTPEFQNASKHHAARNATAVVIHQVPFKELVSEKTQNFK